MAEPSAEKTFELFSEQWKRRDPDFQLNNEEVRDKLMCLVSAAMSVLILSPEVFDQFIAGCTAVATNVVPREAQEKIKSAVKSA